MRQVYAAGYRHDADEACRSLPARVTLQHKYLGAAAGAGTSRSVLLSFPPCRCTGGDP